MAIDNLWDQVAVSVKRFFNVTCWVNYLRRIVKREKHITCILS